MRKNLLKSMVALAAFCLGSSTVSAKNWSINFLELGAKYADKTGVTISEAVTGNVGTCSIVDGTLITPIVDEETGETVATTASDELNSNFTLQSGSSWLVRPGGLYSANGGGRTLALLNCEAGQTISIAISIQPALTSTDIAEYDVDNSGDGVYLYTVKEDGNVFFSITRYSYITNITVENTEWSVDFLELGAKYADKTGVTISEAVTGNVGTCSIVDGTLITPIVDEETGETIATTASDEIDERFTLQSGSSWLIRPSGLYSANGGGRTLAIRDARKDQTITIAITIAPSLTSENAEIKSNSDGVYVYTVKEDGDVFFSITRYSYITKIAVADVQGVDYTVKFVDEEGNTLKEDAVHKGEAGAAIELTTSDKAAFYVDGVKYLYKESDESNNTIAEDGSTVVTVTFRVAKTCVAVLTCKTTDGTTIKQFRDDDTYTFLEGDSYTMYPPIGMKFNDAYYFCPVTVTNNGAPYHGTTIDVTTATSPVTNPQNGKIYYMITKNDYSKSAAAEDGYGYVAGQDSVAYYAEVEDLTLVGEVKSMVGWTEILYGKGNYFDRFSQGCGPRLTEGSYFYTEAMADAAKYRVSVYLRNGANGNESAAYGMRDAEGNVSLFDITPAVWAGAGMGWENIEVSIPAGSSFVIKNNGDAGDIDFDCVSMTKIGDYEDSVVDAINTVKESNQNNGITFNLSGQKVSSSFKGIVIQNGKKFVVK